MGYLRSGLTKERMVYNQFIYYLKKYTENKKNKIVIKKNNFIKILSILLTYKNIHFLPIETKKILYIKLVESYSNDEKNSYLIDKYKDILL